MEQVRLALKSGTYEFVPYETRGGYEPDTKLFSFSNDFAMWHR